MSYSISRKSLSFGAVLQSNRESSTIPATWYNFCPGVDQEKWWQKNKVPLHPNRRNQWVVQLRGHSYSNEEAKNHVEYVMNSYWFGTWSPDHGRIEDMRFEVISSPESIAPKFGEPVVQWSQTVDPDTGKSPGMTWDEDQNYPAVFVAVSFVYRGSLTELPWPTYRKWTGVLNQPNWSCPNGVTAGVFSVYPPSSEAVKPENPCDARGSWWENPKCNPLLPSNWGILGWSLAAGAGLTAIYYAWPLLSVGGKALSAASKARSRAVEASEEPERRSASLAKRKDLPSKRTRK